MLKVGFKVSETVEKLIKRGSKTFSRKLLNNEY
ncbi:hypothetical protein X925_05445 [Petrotoga sp. 9T1HF07.CasAA.8.2]|nr:hypothetical protein X925_05445 [Petrotoga sp. 9T1HF07.CasAA.8.2]PNR92715.1 hypothetical protein X926_05690 [Petrotoga sp. HWHPT.55.6.3]